MQTHFARVVPLRHPARAFRAARYNRLAGILWYRASGQNPDFETAREKTSKFVPERLRFSGLGCGRDATC